MTDISNMADYLIEYASSAFRCQDRDDLESVLIDYFKENDGWIPVSERLPKNEKGVEVTYVRSFNNTRSTCRAFYMDGNMWSRQSLYHWDLSNVDIDEEQDDFKIPEGWYEWVDFTEEFNAIDEKVIAWRPVGEPYKG